MKSINVAVIGATGMVGTTLLQILEERNFPIHQLYYTPPRNRAVRWFDIVI